MKRARFGGLGVFTVHRGLGVLALGLCAALSACAGRSVEQTYYPAPPPTGPASAEAPRTVVAEPARYDGVYIEDTYVYDGATTVEQPAIGYETLSSGDRVEVVYYVHTYPEPIETYPSVYWSGRWYYNVNGDFVFWSPAYHRWCYYWGPPAPLVAYWNSYYPWAPYAWGVGFYGPGWYWGGVGVYGYHSYGVPVNHHHHHHHARWEGHGRGRAPVVHKGGPTTGPAHAGGAVPPGRRPATRVGSAGRRDQPAGVGEGAVRREQPVIANTPGRQPTGAGRHDQPTLASTPGRQPTGVGRQGQPDPTGPGRHAVGTVRDAAPQPTLAGTDTSSPVRTRTVTSPGRRSPGAAGNGQSFTTAGGQRVQTVSPGQPPSRRAVTLGSVRSSPPPPRANVSSPASQWAPVHAPASREATPTRATDAWNAAAGRRDSPGASRSFDAGSTRAATPSHAAPSRSYSPPSRATAPSQAAPSRSYSPPSRSAAPSRSYSPPSRSYSPPSRSAAPSRSFSPAPRSAPVRSAPSHGGGGAGRRR